MTSWYTLAFEYHVAVDPPANRHGGARMHDKLPVLLGRAILRLLRQTGMSPANISKRFYKQRFSFFLVQELGLQKQVPNAKGQDAPRVRVTVITFPAVFPSFLPPSFIPSSPSVTTPLHGPRPLMKGKDCLRVWVVYLPYLRCCFLRCLLSGFQEVCLWAVLCMEFFPCFANIWPWTNALGQPYSDISKRLDAWAKFQIKSGMDDMV